MTGSPKIQKTKQRCWYKKPCLQNP